MASLLGIVAALSSVALLAIVFAGRRHPGCQCGRCRKKHTPWLRCRLVNSESMAVLEFVSGPMAGQTLQVGERITTIGSVANNDIVLADPAVSQKHFRIVRSKGSFQLEDLGSTNGCFQNGHRAERCILADEDCIGVGNSKILFRIR